MGPLDFLQKMYGDLPPSLGPVGPGSNAPVFGNPTADEPVDRNDRKVKRLAFFHPRAKPAHGDPVAFFHHIQSFDFGARHQIHERLKHLLRALVPVTVSADAWIMELKILSEPVGDMIDVANAECGGELTKQILLC